MDSLLQYGVCRLAVVPMRAEPSQKAELINQLLFGEHYRVLQVQPDRQWLYIQAAWDGYLGWISMSQFTEITEAYFEQIETADFKISIDLVSSILYQKQRMNIVMGAVLPFTGTELFKIEESLAFGGESKPLGQRWGMPFLKDIAFKYINTPYLWGGKSPFGIDCSGFIQMVFKICGYRLNRDASQQVLQGDEVNEFEKVKAGDLAFFCEKDGRVSHVGLVIDNLHIIHASGKVRVDLLSPDGIFNLDNQVLTHNLHSIRRIIRKEI
jgi:gamma-D-glutamyl-L-lysine dipeptidyl-peptidase